MIDLEWFTAYSTLVLEWDYPILEAVSLYFESVEATLNDFNIYGPVELSSESNRYAVLAWIHQQGDRLRYISPEIQTHRPEWCVAAVRNDPTALRYVQQPTPEIMQIVAPHALKDQAHRTAYEKALTRCSEGLAYVPNPTISMVVAALDHDLSSLQLVQHLTVELCMAAVKHNGMAIQYIPTELQAARPEIGAWAIAQTRNALLYVKPLTQDVLFRALDLISDAMLCLYLIDMALLALGYSALEPGARAMAHSAMKTAMTQSPPECRQALIAIIPLVVSIIQTIQE